MIQYFRFVLVFYIAGRVENYPLVNEEQTLIDKLGKFQVDRKRYDELACNVSDINERSKYSKPDLDIAKENMTRNRDTEVAARILENVFLPGKDHLYDEIRHLVELQQTYNLTVSEMIDGHLEHSITIQPALTAEDCFSIGVTCAEKHDHETAIDWLQGCESRIDNVKTQNLASEIRISSALFVGDFHPPCKNDDPLTCTELKKKQFEDILHRMDQKLASKQGHSSVEDWKGFKQACAGDYEDEAPSKLLKCRYNHHNSPFLTIAPLKEEMLSLAPKVSLFLEVVYESEIESLKNDARDLFRNVNVLRRNGQIATLYNLDHKYIGLKNRLSDVSSLSMKFSEHFQMLHYAPGGFYPVHTDFVLSNCTTCDVVGNRIANALIYLSDVKLGGNTVFPRLKLGVRVVKGAILFWMNMKVDGSEEGLTRHAACPVIYGEKMASTRRYRMNGQDHWIAEPEDDLAANHTINPNIMCPRRLAS